MSSSVLLYEGRAGRRRCPAPPDGMGDGLGSVRVERALDLVHDVGDALRVGRAAGAGLALALAAVVGAEQLRVRRGQQADVLAADRLGLVQDLLLVDEGEALRPTALGGLALGVE